MIRTQPTDTPATLANRICMLGLCGVGELLLVEGVLDEQVYCNYTQGTCKIYKGGTKDIVIGVVPELLKRGKTNFIAIVDADFDHLNSVSSPSRVYYTDTHDIETMMCSKVLGDYAKQKFNGKKVKTSEMMEAILEVAKWAGVCRWRYAKYSYKNKTGDRLNLGRCVAYKGGLPKLEKDIFFDELARFNPKISAAEKALVIASVDSCMRSGSPVDIWQLIQGHDLIRVLISVLGKYSISVDVESVENGLLAQYNAGGCFPKTDLYAAVAGSPSPVW